MHFNHRINDWEEIFDKEEDRDKPKIAFYTGKENQDEKEIELTTLKIINIENIKISHTLSIITNHSYYHSKAFDFLLISKSSFATSIFAVAHSLMVFVTLILSKIFFKA